MSIHIGSDDVRPSSPHRRHQPTPESLPSEPKRLTAYTAAGLLATVVVVAAGHQSAQEAADEFQGEVDQVAVANGHAFVGTNTIHDGRDSWEGRFSVRMMLVTPEPLQAPRVGVYSVTRSTPLLAGPAEVLSATKRPDGTWVTMAESSVFMAAVADEVDIEVSAVGIEPIQVTSVLDLKDTNVGLDHQAPDLGR